MRVVFDISEPLARAIDQMFGSASVTRQLNEIQETLEIIMGNQAEFDAKITAANTALEGITAAIAAEAAQIAEFIAANPAVDTSALDGVVTRLESVGTSIGSVFEPPVVEE